MRDNRMFNEVDSFVGRFSVLLHAAVQWASPQVPHVSSGLRQSWTMCPVYFWHFRHLRGVMFTLYNCCAKVAEVCAV